MCTKKLKPFYVPSSHKVKLNKYLKSKKVTPTIESYILNEYTGPTKSIEQLKEKNEEFAIMNLYLSDEAVKKLDSFLMDEDPTITRSHIFRDVISNIVSGLSLDKIVEDKLDDVLEELTKIAPREIIYEAIQKYQLKHYA